MTSLVSGGRVSVTSADKGEVVLVVWAEEHNNYAVYHEVRTMMEDDLEMVEDDLQGVFL